MTEVRFDLEPHQWPPQAQGERLGLADAVFAVEWDGAQVEVAARLVPIGIESFLMFFRALESSQIYVVATSSGIRLSPRLRYPINQESKIEFLKEQLPKVVEDNDLATYGRLLPFRQSREEQINLFVAHDGASGAWIAESRVGWTPFRSDSQTDLAAQALANPSSPAGYALLWSQLSDEQRRERALCFANGDWNEFRRIARAAACFDVPTFSGYDIWIAFDESFHLKTGQLHLDNYDPGVRLRRWGYYIRNYFAPHRNDVLAARHLCVAQQSLSPILSFKPPQPNQHERLEAALTLRDWAKGKIPPREARLLLPKL